MLLYSRHFNRPFALNKFSLCKANAWLKANWKQLNCSGAQKCLKSIYPFTISFEFPLSWSRNFWRLRLIVKELKTTLHTLFRTSHVFFLRMWFTDCFEMVNAKMNVSLDNKASYWCTCSIQPPLLSYSKLNPPVSLTKLIPECKCFCLQALCALCCSILMLGLVVSLTDWDPSMMFHSVISTLLNPEVNYRKINMTLQAIRLCY